MLGTRIEWLLDQTQPSERQTEELLKMQRSLSHIIRLNKTLLLLTKIENGQFPENSTIDLRAVVQEQTDLYNEIYASRNLSCHVNISGEFTVKMNESLASTLINNLLKNAFIHSEAGSKIIISMQDQTLTISNDGTKQLDATQIFNRFYQGEKKEGSTGLGLALVKAVCRYYHLNLEYRFNKDRHYFSVTWP